MKNFLMHFCTGDSLGKVPDSWGAHSKAQSPITPLPLRHRNKKNVGGNDFLLSTHFQNFISSKLCWCHISDTAVFPLFLVEKRVFEKILWSFGESSHSCFTFHLKPSQGQLEKVLLSCCSSLKSPREPADVSKPGTKAVLTGEPRSRRVPTGGLDSASLV